MLAYVLGVGVLAIRQMFASVAKDFFLHKSTPSRIGSAANGAVVSVLLLCGECDIAVNTTLLYFLFDLALLFSENTITFNGLDAHAVSIIHHSIGLILCAGSSYAGFTKPWHPTYYLVFSLVAMETTNPLFQAAMIMRNEKSQIWQNADFRYWMCVAVLTQWTFMRIVYVGMHLYLLEKTKLSFLASFLFMQSTLMWLIQIVWCGKLFSSIIDVVRVDPKEY
jgi:hypothetical protein